MPLINSDFVEHSSIHKLDEHSSYHVAAEEPIGFRSAASMKHGHRFTLDIVQEFHAGYCPRGRDRAAGG